MRVGDGRRGATAAIARRARLGPGALRPDGQCSLRRIARDRAATGAHRRQDDHRRGERALDDMAFVGQARRAVVNDPDIGRSAADIDADQVAVTRGGTDEGKPRSRRPPSRQCPSRSTGTAITPPDKAREPFDEAALTKPDRCDRGACRPAPSPKRASRTKARNSSSLN